jgi:cytochrome c553
MKKALFCSMLLALAGVTSTAQAQAAKPAPTAAVIESKIAMCIGCHGIKGYQASFPEIHKVPMISGQSGKYIVAALTAYKKGERKHPTMRAIAASLSEQDMADIAGYYEKLGKDGAALPEQPAAAPADVAALLTKGACASCHGPNFSKPIDGSYPKIAGQYADFLYVALKAYKTEGNPNIGRGNAIMSGQAKQFSNVELRALANYLASLPSELHTVPQSKFRKPHWLKLGGRAMRGTPVFLVRGWGGGAERRPPAPQQQRISHTLTLDRAIAPPAITGLRAPRPASGMPTTL